MYSISRDLASVSGAFSWCLWDLLEIGGYGQKGSLREVDICSFLDVNWCFY